jgi:tetratricopeptide (TPR) repeat protein
MKRLLLPLVLRGLLSASGLAASLAFSPPASAAESTPPHGAVDAASLPPGTPPSPAASGDKLQSSNLVAHPAKFRPAAFVKNYREQLDLARQMRREKDPAAAGRMLVSLLEDAETPPDIQRAALFDLALVAQDDRNPARAQQILAQFLKKYPQDPAVPEVLLRQGLLYRQMGAHQMAITKFYAVMNSSLSMKLDQLDYYQRLVLQAQTEVADTHFEQGQFAEALDFYRRLLKQPPPELNLAPIRYKALRCQSSLGRTVEVVAAAEAFLEKHSDAPEAAEARFLCASALKQLNRNAEAARQVLQLLEAQQRQATNHPAAWTYWQLRAGNEIANQFYLEGDYVSALEIYTRLASLDPSPEWQLPVWYQIGLVHERLQQPQKAVEIFTAIAKREKELVGPALTPGLKAVFDMARWRQEHLGWQARAELAAQSVRPLPSFRTNAPAGVPATAHP